MLLGIMINHTLGVCQPTPRPSSQPEVEAPNIFP